MLEKLNKALGEIQKSREEELLKFKVICEGNKDMLFKRNAVLLTREINR